MSITTIFKKGQSAETRRKLHTHTHTHTSKALLSIFVIFVFVFPSFSDPDIANNVTTPYCDDSILESDTGPVNIEINWEPNEINLHWYDGDTELNVASESQSCLYDTTLTPPVNIPTKTGYTFRGWKTKCVLSNLANLDTSISSSVWASKKISNGSVNNSGGATVATYGLTQNGEWGITFSYGKLKGIAYCSAKVGNNNNETFTNAKSNWLALADEIIAAGTGTYCWCNAQIFTRSSDNTKCLLNMKAVYVRTLTDNCTSKCAQRCAELISYGTHDKKRIALYNQ